MGISAVIEKESYKNYRRRANLISIHSNYQLQMLLPNLNCNLFLLETLQFEMNLPIIADGHLNEIHYFLNVLPYSGAEVLETFALHSLFSGISHKIISFYLL